MLLQHYANMIDFGLTVAQSDLFSATQLTSLVSDLSDRTCRSVMARKYTCRRSLFLVTIITHVRLLKPDMIVDDSDLVREVDSAFSQDVFSRDRHNHDPNHLIL